MRKPFNPLPVGSSMINASLPGTEQINGIIVDNPSGQWLFITPLYEYVPPYTMGWSRNLSGGVTQVSVVPGNGPAGQVSTLAGDPVHVVLDSEQVGVSQGATENDPFIKQFTPVLGLQIGTGVNPASTGAGQLILAAIPGKRFRLYSWTVARTLPDFGQSDNGGGLRAVLFNDTDQEDRLFLQNDEMERGHLYPGGLDFPISNAVTVFYKPAWTDQPCVTLITYSVI